MSDTPVSAPSRSGQQAPSTAAEFSSSSSAWRHALVFPSPALALPTRVLQRSQRVLIQLQQGSCWHLSGQGLQPTVAMLDRLAGALGEHVESGAPPDETTGWLTERLELIVNARPLHLDDLNAADWPLRDLAVNCVVSSALELHRSAGKTASQSNPTPSSQAVSDLVDRFGQDLQAQLEVFRAHAIDPLVEQVAARFDTDDSLVYAYLAADQRHRTYRLQAAEAAAIFMPCIASGSSAFHGVRRAIDEGASLPQALGAACEVSPSTLRIVMTSACAEACLPRWSRDSIGLARLIDRMQPPELRPRTIVQWQSFSTCVEAFERKTQGRIDDAIFGALWLQAETRRRRKRLATLSTDDPRQPTADVAPDVDLDAMRQVDALRRLLVGVVAAELGDRHQQQRTSWQHEVERGVDVAMGRGGINHWKKIAARVHDALGQRIECKEVAMASEMLSGERTWPVTSAPFSSSDGGTIVTLRSTAELQAHGVQMRICLAGSELQRYARACKSGRHFVVALINSAGRPRSTAELEISLQPGQHRWQVTIRQHTAYGNAEPGPRCRQALSELIDHLATSPDAQRHLALGVKLRRGFQGRVSPRQSAAELLRHLQAVTVAMGPAAYAALRATCAARLSEKSLPVSLRELLPQ